MLKYSGDLLEKLTAGSLVVGLFSDKTPAMVLGLSFCAGWIILRLMETHLARRKTK